MIQLPTITVFAGSRLPDDLQAIDAANELGEALGRAGIGIHYGAGTQGLMGQVAQAVARTGGRVFAYVLDRYKDEPQIAGAVCKTVTTEQERFTCMTTTLQPMAMIVLPGGPGAMREALQALEGAVYDQGPPVILIKTGPYLDGIKHYFDHAVKSGFVKREHEDKLKLLTVRETMMFLATLSNTPSANVIKKPSGPA